MTEELDELVIVQALGNDVLERLVKKTIRDIEEITTTTSNNPNLENAWDEFCVQAQGEHSIYWEAYQRQLEDCARVNLADLKSYERDAAWFLTEMADQWIDERDSWRYQQWRSRFRNESEAEEALSFNYDPESDTSCPADDEYETHPVFDEDVLDLIKNRVNSEACNWSNERIRKYFDEQSF